MGIALNLIAGALVLVWMVEYFGYNAGNGIHALLLIAIVVLGARVSMLLPWRKAGVK